MTKQHQVKLFVSIKENDSFILSLTIEEDDAIPNISKTVMILIANWTITWTPFAVVSLIGIAGFGKKITVSYMLSYISIIMLF